MTPLAPINVNAVVNHYNLDYARYFPDACSTTPVRSRMISTARPAESQPECRPFLTATPDDAIAVAADVSAETSRAIAWNFDGFVSIRAAGQPAVSFPGPEPARSLLDSSRATRPHGGGFFNDEEELTAAIERAIGPEAAEAARRSLRLAQNPRTLTDAERAELRANLEPVLRDMRSSGAIVPDIIEEAHDDLGPDCVCARIQSPGGGPVPGASGSRSAFRPRSGSLTSRTSCRSGRSRSSPPQDAPRPGRSARSTPVPTRWLPGPRRPGRMVLPGIRASHQGHRSAAVDVNRAVAAHRRMPEVTGRARARSREHDRVRGLHPGCRGCHTVPYRRP